MSSVIQLAGLSKIYKSGGREVNAVENLSFDVERCQIYGFLGPNGAGKTTTIRMLLRLLFPTSGAAYLFGKPLVDAVDILRQKVGALAEEATLYPFMSAYQNLQTLGATSGHYDRKRIEYVLDLVGMSAYRDRRANTFSTGMKQRLGVAAALLHDPDLLILDEPTSGLDPKGIQDMRDLMRHLVHNEGKTIFLSSHLLNEIEQTCERVAIINSGRLVQEGRVSDLLAGSNLVQINAQPLAEAKNLLSATFDVQVVDEMLEFAARSEQIPKAVALLTAHDLKVYEVRHKRRTLEDYFLEVTDA